MSDLPLQLGIRTFLADVSFGNPLPDWFSPREVDFVARQRTLSTRASSYLKGSPTLPVLMVKAPSRSGEMRDWMVPAVNDQMLLNACACSLSPAIAKRFDAKHVYSCQPNANPNRIALMTNQLAAWLDFQQETIKRVQADHYVLEFDIRKAFASIDRPDFLKYVAGLGANSATTDVLTALLNNWDRSGKGLPLINDSLFFIGSAYFEKVDRIVSRYTTNFIRYMDDYRLFAATSAGLEGQYEKISRDLAAIGLAMNPSKVKLASKADYAEPVTTPKFQETTANTYVIELDTGIASQLEPDQLVALVRKALDRPTEYLNDGTGRFLLGAMRSYRVNKQIYVNVDSIRPVPGRQLHDLLVEAPNVASLTETRLAQYASDAQQYWRVVWLTYLVEQSQRTKATDSTLQAVMGNKAMPVVARLWAKRCLEGRTQDITNLPEELGDLGYIDAGRKCYGDPKCKDAAF